MTERVALKIKLTIVEYRTHRYPFTRRRDMASCPWTKQSHLGKWSSGKLRTSALVNDETLRSIADSALNKEKLILLKYLISLRFICCCLLPYFLIWKSFAVEVYISRKLQDYENIHGRDSFLITKQNLWQKFLSIFTCNFAKTYLHGHLLVYLKSGTRDPRLLVGPETPDLESSRR